MFTLRTATTRDLPRNIEIWRTSVLATHHFLSPEDFSHISELVEKLYLPTADITVAVDANDVAHGFMSATGDHVDALFVHAESRSQGVGRLLLLSHLASRAEAAVDVNEQNVSGRGFYEAVGFKQVGRADADSEGRPYPLLHMRWKNMRGELAIREYRPNDLDDLMEVFNRAIRETACKDYTSAQLDAWAQPDRQIWAERRLSRPTWVAEVDGQVVGFTDLELDGHIDMMYVHPCAAGKGVARALLQKAEEHALLIGISSLYAEVSFTARPFFEKNMFSVVEPERVFRNGQHFDRFKMKKSLEPRPGAGHGSAVDRGTPPGAEV